VDPLGEFQFSSVQLSSVQFSSARFSLLMALLTAGYCNTRQSSQFPDDQSLLRENTLNQNKKIHPEFIKKKK
jgi:hypothetical protein